MPAVAESPAVPQTQQAAASPRGPHRVTYSDAGRHRVVVIGGGFAGLNAVQDLRRADVDVTLVDRRNHHLFQPLLYQVATGTLSPANIAAPLRGVVEKQKNCTTVLGEAVEFDFTRRVVKLSGDQNPTTAGGPEDEVPYDTLIVASGSNHSYFGNDAWAPFAPGLKTIEDAIEIRRRILLAFEEAEREPDPDKRKAWLTFVLVGGGPTGVELAGSIAEIARRTLRDDFRRIDPAEANIIIADGGPRVLSAYDEELSRYAARDLKELGVTIHSDTRATDVSATHVTLTPEDGSPAFDIAARTVVWCAGVRASRLGRKLAAALADAAGRDRDAVTEEVCDRAGRVNVLPNCTLPGKPEVFVLGDLARFVHDDSGEDGGWGPGTGDAQQQGAKTETVGGGNNEAGEPLPGVAQVALQQGKYCAKTLKGRLAGKEDKAFRYNDLGTMAVIGRGSAVADLFGKYHATGTLAWLMWLVIHVMYIVSFQSRLLVLVQWFYHYATFDRGARLITGQTLPIAHTLGENGKGDDAKDGADGGAKADPAPADPAADGAPTIPSLGRTPLPAGAAMTSPTLTAAR